MDKGGGSSVPQSDGSLQKGTDWGHPERKSNTVFILKGGGRVEKEVASQSLVERNHGLACQSLQDLFLLVLSSQLLR